MPQETEVRVLGANRKPVDAAINLTDGIVILHSRGGGTEDTPARNTGYSEALDLILTRLGGAGIAIERILVDSDPARKMSATERTVAIRSDFARLPLDEVKRQIRRGMRALGRPAGASPNQGNATKRLRFEIAADLATLRRVLRAAPRTSPPAGRPRPPSQSTAGSAAANGVFKAIEVASAVRSASARWRTAFSFEAEKIGTMSGRPVLWQEKVEIWGVFGKTHGRGGVERDWNAFGQKPHAFSSNMIVEINPPPRGVDVNLQGIFATDDDEGRWLLHQGRMSIPGSRVTEADFIQATGLQPVEVSFSNGSTRRYHKVAPIDAPAPVMVERMAAFLAHCSTARLSKSAPARTIENLAKAQEWERGLSPEGTGDFEFGSRSGGRGRRHHGDVWRALSLALERLKVPHSNDRIGQYGPDLFTWGDGPKVLFEIKTSPDPRDVFEGVGQLHIYEQLLGARYRKVLVVPEGMRQALKGPVSELKIDTVEFRRAGRKVMLDESSLSKCLER